MKIDFFKKEKSFKKKDFIFHLNLYWIVVLIITISIIFLSFIFSYRLFMQINQEPILSVTNKNGQLPVVNQDRIEKVLNVFSERESNSKQILNSSLSVVDPSL
ncbi:MAG: hypothetical protein WCW93_01835 [Candidatus Paceibacterota bacterium]